MTIQGEAQNFHYQISEISRNWKKNPHIPQEEKWKSLHLTSIADAELATTEISGEFYKRS